MGACAEMPAERYEKGVALKIEGRYDEAIEEFQSVLVLDPDNVPARVQLGLVYGFVGLFDESLAILQEAVAMAPFDLDARNNLGLTYCMLGMIDEAKAEFNFVLERDPSNEVALKNMMYF